MADFSPGSRVNLMVSKPGSGFGQLEGIEAPTTEAVTIILQSRPLSGVSCTIRNEQGEPVAGARLSFLTQETKRLMRLGSSWSWGLMSTLTADEDGHYAGPIAGPGLVTLQVTAQGYLPKEIDFEVPDGQGGQELEIVLQRAPAVLVGQVTGPGGEPVVPDLLSVYQQEHAGQRFSPGPVEPPHTDDQGRFRVEGLTDGAWTVSATAQGYRCEKSTLEMHAGENRLDIHLGREAAVEGQVVDPAGRPVVGAVLSLQAKNPYLYAAGTNSDATGHFAVTCADPGLYSLEATAPGFQKASLPEISVGGPAVRGLRIVLDPDPASRAHGSLSGRILGLDAKRLGEVKVVYASRPDGTSMSSPVGAHGEYRIAGLAPGEWTVSANTSHRRADAKVTVAEANEAHADLEFPPAVALSGRVLRRGEPVAETRVTALGPGGWANAVCNQRGEFRLEDVAAGSYRIRFSSPSPSLGLGFGLMKEQAIDLQSDRWIDVELPANRLSGRVVTADSAPVAWAEVILKTPLYDNGRYEAARTQTDADGAFTFQNIAVATYGVTVERDGFLPAETSVQVEDGGEADVRLTLQPKPPGR